MTDFNNKMFDFTEGYLEIILGPMFSGKTTELIRIYKTYDFIGQTPIVINYLGDTRYSTTHLSSHDEIKIPCIFIDKLMNIIEKDCIKNVDVVLINEGQFFDDLYEFVVTLVEKYNKKVFICGLDGDFKQKNLELY